MNIISGFVLGLLGSILALGLLCLTLYFYYWLERHDQDSSFRQVLQWQSTLSDPAMERSQRRLSDDINEQQQSNYRPSNIYNTPTPRSYTMPSQFVELAEPSLTYRGRSPRFEGRGADHVAIEMDHGRSQHAVQNAQHVFPPSAKGHIQRREVRGSGLRTVS